MYNAPGPSTGMPTRTQQSDILLAAYASHGDTKHPLLFPANPKECFEMTADAFDLTERLQTPVILMTDLDLGMNDHVTDPIAWDDSRVYDRGKVLTSEQLDKIYAVAHNGNGNGDTTGTQPPSAATYDASSDVTIANDDFDGGTVDAGEAPAFPALTANGDDIWTSTTMVFRIERFRAHMRPMEHL